MTEWHVKKLMGGVGNSADAPADWQSGIEQEYILPGTEDSSVYGQRQFFAEGDVYYVWVEKGVPFDLFVGWMRWHFEMSREDVFEKQKQMLSESFKSVAAYTNIVMVVGYAALFSMWMNDGLSFTPATKLWAGICIAVSVLFFISWELAQAWVRSMLNLKTAKAVSDIGLFRQRLQAVNDFQLFIAQWYQPYWLVAYVGALLFGLIAFGILLSGMLHGAWLEFLTASMRAVAPH